VAGPRLDLVVVGFSFGVSTADAFRWWDQDGAISGPAPEGALSALERIAVRGDDPGAGVRAEAGAFSNDLAGPVIRRHDEIRLVIERLRAAGIPAFMPGSGPTVIGVLSSAESRLGLDEEQALEEIAGRPVRYAATIAG
jgi:4-diphosphocytidyl-2C-methyl-D-erythritol kinase